MTKNNNDDQLSFDFSNKDDKEGKSNNNNDVRIMTEAELEDMENRVREDFKNGDLDVDSVWKLIGSHARDLAVGCSYRPSRAVALMAVMLFKMPVTLDQLLEANPDHREKLEEVQTLYQMLRHTLYGSYNVDNILNEEQHLEFAKNSWYEMNAFMSVTSCYQDLAYMGAVINYACQQMVGDWAEFLEDGFTEDRADGLKTWKRLASAARLANAAI